MAVPVPVNPAVVPPAPVTLMVELRAPEALGVNVIVKVALPPAGIVVEDKAVVIGNSDVLVLATAMPDTDTVPELVIVY